MDNLWKAFKQGDWPFVQTIRPKPQPAIHKSFSNEGTCLLIPGSKKVFSLNHSGQAIWDLCDGQRTIGEIYQEWRRNAGNAGNKLVTEFTKILLQLHGVGALEFLGLEDSGLEKTCSLDLRDITFYVINCPADDKKREFIQQQLLEKQLTFKFINGVKCSPHYVGIALSHLKILRSPEVSPPFAILEDDCQFTQSFHSRFEVPVGTDALYLGVSYFATNTPGEFSTGRWKNTQFRQYNVDYLRVFNMLGRHAIVYLTEKFRQSAVEASFQALFNHEKPYPADIGYAMLQPSHLVLTPNDPICYQSEQYKGNHGATKYSLRVIRKVRDAS